MRETGLLSYHVGEVFEFESHESLPERLIREAIERGDFDDVPGQGRPVPGVGIPDDELWWVRQWLDRNRHPINESPS